jgi:DNA-binding IclR family transcriptional regulator
MVPALVKSLWVIRYLNRRAPLGVSLAELSKQGQITPSHCYNILQTLAAHDWVSYDSAQRLYRLKAGLLADIGSVLSGALPMDEIHAVLRRLAREVSVLCILSRAQPDGSFIVIDSIDGGTDVGISVPIGTRFPPDAPLHCKAWHAWAPRNETEAWLENWKPNPFTSRTITSRPAMLEAFEETRRNGYAMQVGEHVDGVMSVGLPVFDTRSQPIMVVQCPGVRAVIESRLEQLKIALPGAVAEIHRRIGGRPPAGFTKD